LSPRGTGSCLRPNKDRYIPLPQRTLTLLRRQWLTHRNPLLFRTSAAALQQLAQDPRFLGGQIGMLGVMQTWTRDLRYHPLVHYLVPALALTPDAKGRAGREA